MLHLTGHCGGIQQFSKFCLVVVVLPGTSSYEGLGVGRSSATKILSSVLWHLRGATKDHMKTTGVVPCTG